MTKRRTTRRATREENFVSKVNENSEILVLQMNQALSRLKKLTEKDLAALSITDSKVLLNIFGKRKCENDQLFDNFVKCTDRGGIQQYTTAVSGKETLDSFR